MHLIHIYLLHIEHELKGLLYKQISHLYGIKKSLLLMLLYINIIINQLFIFLKNKNEYLKIKNG